MATSSYVTCFEITLAPMTKHRNDPISGFATKGAKQRVPRYALHNGIQDNDTQHNNKKVTPSIRSRKHNAQEC
jgi:hypothetical protein